MQNRTLKLFENSSNSQKTLETRKYNLDKFLEWCHKDYESLLMLGQREIEDLLQDYVIYLRKKVKVGDLSPNSFGTIFYAIFKYLKYGRKNIDKGLILELFPETVKCGGDKAVSTDQAKILLDSATNKRDKAIIHFLASTGARPEAVCDLMLKDVSEWRDGFLKVVLYAGDKHEMITFLNPEAAKAFNEYQEWRKNVKKENVIMKSYVFRTAPYNSAHVEPQKMSVLTLGGKMRRLWKNSGIKRIKSGRRFDLAVTTSFRKRFDTILEFNPEVPIGAVQYLMDHTGYLSGKHYRRPTEEQIFHACEAVSSDLMISNEWRLKQELEKKTTEESDKDKRIELLEGKLVNVETILLELQARNNT